MKNTHLLRCLCPSSFKVRSRTPHSSGLQAPCIRAFLNSLERKPALPGERRVSGVVRRQAKGCRPQAEGRKQKNPPSSLCKSERRGIFIFAGHLTEMALFVVIPSKEGIHGFRVRHGMTKNPEKLDFGPFDSPRFSYGVSSSTPISLKTFSNRISHVCMERARSKPALRIRSASSGCASRCRILPTRSSNPS